MDAFYEIFHFSNEGRKIDKLEIIGRTGGHRNFFSVHMHIFQLRILSQKSKYHLPTFSLGCLPELLAELSTR